MITRIATLATAAMLATAAVQTPPPAIAQQQASPRQPSMTPQQAQQAMQALAKFRHEALTPEKAKAAIEAFLTLKKKYPAGTFKPETPGPVGVTEAMKASEQAQEVEQLVKDKGFASIDEWAKVFTSVGMALAYVRDGDDNAEKKLKEVEASPMPDQIKQQIIAMLKAVIPPEQNIEVAKQLLADEQTKKMIEAVEQAR